jgi:hypothetical protein
MTLDLRVSVWPDGHCTIDLTDPNLNRGTTLGILQQLIGKVPNTPSQVPCPLGQSPDNSLKVNSRTGTIRYRGQDAQLDPNTKGFRILALLAERPAMGRSLGLVLDHVWGVLHEVKESVIKAHLYLIRGHLRALGGVFVALADCLSSDKEQVRIDLSLDQSV